ncbi:VOC domain-containing protein [Caenorhabditis elegans]|uniref:VOC domain-containing protein n=1 Tax=Caenorhabditis elegans TaxID=6239 RepID=F5GUF2_CAEEL|nr:VOC domain-containing protein [Caenorhabditis elegans]CCA65528.1 VOC domain-containing protein [Caenorhabditis elegans]|eukprot:NP_001256678.1 Uncharacterized protein CELE_B0391.14 [Caenorhabditis elegans]
MPADIIREVASNVSFIKREKLDKGVEYFRKALDKTSEKFGMGVVIGELSSHLCHFGNKVTYEQTRSGCSIHSGTNTKALANGRYQNELALNDFSWIMKLPNLQLSSLVVSLLLDAQVIRVLCVTLRGGCTPRFANT